jgi:hypothetical protein
MKIIEEIDKEIEATEVAFRAMQERLNALLATRQIFAEKSGASINTQKSLPFKEKPTSEVNNPGTNRKESVSSQVIPVVQKILSDGVPRKTKELLPLVLQEGILIGGSDMATGLSAILSRKDEIFRGDKKVGWTLAKQADNKGG